ncbi:MAG: histidine phosphatase family protein [Candidatus Micrarchaeaceae archaeon]
MAVKITYFVHGTTTDNEKDLATGWKQGKLSALGKRQAKELAKLVVDRHFDVMFCSDLKRAVDSANLGFKGKYKIIKDKRLRECNYGGLTGTPSKGFKDKLDSYVKVKFPNGESYKDVERRMRSFVKFLKNKYDGKHVAIMAHQAPQLALEVISNGKTWNQAIAQDWRRKSAWKAGWDYTIK